MINVMALMVVLTADTCIAVKPKDVMVRPNMPRLIPQLIPAQSAYSTPLFFIFRQALILISARKKPTG